MKALALVASLAAFGLAACARDRDFAVVEPTLSRQYQVGATAAASPPSANVVGIQPVQGQRGVVQPVYQSQPMAPPAGAVAPPAVGTVALPPASSTGAPAAGQPYYVPSPPVAAAPSLPPPSLAPAPGMMATHAGVQAGVYPAAATGMWMPTNGNQAIAIHQFSTPTTGSSFMPAIPSDGSTGSTLRTADGVIPAGATVPWVSQIPAGIPPAASRMPLMSETGEHMRPSQLPATPPAASALPGGAAPPPGIMREEPPPVSARPTPPLKREESPALRRTPRDDDSPPVPSDDDKSPSRPQRKPGENLEASPADPPRGNSSPRNEAANEKKDAPKKLDLGEPTPPPLKKTPTKKEDSGPGPALPDEPPPPSKKLGSGS